MGWGGAGQVGSKKSKAIPTPPPLRDAKNPRGAKQGGASQAAWGEIAILSLILSDFGFWLFDWIGFWVLVVGCA